jgi:hypothetical protein
MVAMVELGSKESRVWFEILFLYHASLFTGFLKRAYISIFVNYLRPSLRGIHRRVSAFWIFTISFEIIVHGFFLLFGQAFKGERYIFYHGIQEQIVTTGDSGLLTIFQTCDNQVTLYHSIVNHEIMCLEREVVSIPQYL